MGPIVHLGDVAVFHRIEMDVVDMRLEVGVIADGMFPIPALPDIPLALAP